MKRCYYQSDDPDVLSRVREALLAGGVAVERVRVRHEPAHPARVRRVNGGSDQGILLGLALGASVVVAAQLSGLVSSMGWIPVLVLGALVLVFCAWESGVIGLRHWYRRRQVPTESARPILVVDVTEDEEPLLDRIERQYPALHWAGSGPAVLP